MKRLAIIFVLSLAFLFSGLGVSPLRADDPPKESSKEEKPVGGKAGEKGGIYVVGRAFKTAGHGMEKGFVKAGKGMEKGFKKAGSGMEKGFKKAGSSIKDFFTGEKKEDK